MSLTGYSPEEIKEMSMVEVAYELMVETKQPFTYGDLINKVAEIKEMSQEEVLERISYLYTDLNIDGRFTSIGENRWGLRSWYKYENPEEEVTQTVKRNKAAKSTDEEDEFLVDEEDEYEDLGDQLDELASEEDGLDDDDDDSVDFEEELEDFDEDAKDLDEDEELEVDEEELL